VEENLKLNPGGKKASAFSKNLRQKSFPILQYLLSVIQQSILLRLAGKKLVCIEFGVRKNASTRQTHKALPQRESIQY
jgi:hypothetical protein